MLHIATARVVTGTHPHVNHTRITYIDMKNQRALAIYMCVCIRTRSNMAFTDISCTSFTGVRARIHYTKIRMHVQATGSH
jgi:hypothetical protein